MQLKIQHLFYLYLLIWKFADNFASIWHVHLLANWTNDRKPYSNISVSNTSNHTCFFSPVSIVSWFQFCKQVLSSVPFAYLTMKFSARLSSVTPLSSHCSLITDVFKQSTMTRNWHWLATSSLVLFAKASPLTARQFGLRLNACPQQSWASSAEAVGSNWCCCEQTTGLLQGGRSSPAAAAAASTNFMALLDEASHPPGLSRWSDDTNLWKI